jgi:ABC-type antimicrobial peptide transport system permease subunit
MLLASNFGGAAFQKATTSTDPNLNGWAIEVVELKKGVSIASGFASLRRISISANKVLNNDPGSQGGNTFVEGDQKPAEILAYQSAGATPFLLASGLSLGAAATLGLALASSIRRRRRDLALLKALGFTQGQIATAVSCQASVTALFGVIVGGPLGIVLGRWLWTTFANRIYAVPDATVPVLQVIFIALGALVMANLVAVIPARSAARTSAALILRAE